MSSTAQQQENVAQVMTNGKVWAVWLSSDATVVELAAIIAGLERAGLKVQADHMGGGAFAIFPTLENTPAPSGEFIAACMQDLPARLPGLVSKWAP